MNRGAACLLVLALLGPAPGRAEPGADPDVGGGPLSLRAAFPPELGLPSYEALAPRVGPKGEWHVGLRVHHANTLVRGGDVKGRRRLVADGEVQPSGYDILVDTESTRVTAEVGVGLGGGWEIQVGLSGTGYSGGFLDSIIEDVHHTFGLKNDNRSDRPRDEVEIAVLGEAGVLDVRDAPTSLSLGDTVISARRMLSEGGPGRSAWMLELALEAPTGNKDRLTGSGDWDGRIAVHGSEGWKGRHFLTWGLGRVMVGDFEAMPLPVEDAWHAHLGYEFYRAGWSVPAQLVLTDSHFGEGEGDGKIDDPRALLQCGVRRGGRGWEFDIGISQNLTLRDNQSDFAVTTGIQWRFGGKSRPSRASVLRRNKAL